MIGAVGDWASYVFEVFGAAARFPVVEEESWVAAKRAGGVDDFCGFFCVGH